MSRILLIDNNLDPDSWGAEDLRTLAALSPDIEITVRRAPHEDLPESPAPYERIVVSGSRASPAANDKWIAKLYDFVRRAIAMHKPYLGVCFGHQTLVAATLGADGLKHVRRSAVPEFGWTKIEKLPNAGPCPLLEGLPETFYSFSSHFEEVHDLPPHFKVQARSRDCAIQAIQWEGRPIFGIQFHPERLVEAGERTILRRLKDGIPVLRPAEGAKLYDPAVGQTIFRNFYKATQ